MTILRSSRRLTNRSPWPAPPSRPGPIRPSAGASTTSAASETCSPTRRPLRRRRRGSGRCLGVARERLGDGEALRQDCAAISNELREQYTAGFVAPDPSRPGYRTLRVDVPGRPELSVRVRKGVTVGSGTEYAGPDGGP